ncbi:MAG: hypothetical protein ACYC0I_04430 [Acidimicrobiales bacterium]
MTHRIFHISLKILGPVLLGFGTIFQAKAHPTDHWSSDPKITIQVEASIEQSGNPPTKEHQEAVQLVP